MNSKHDDDEVQKIESCFVQPSKMLPRQALWLSPLDIIKASRGHTPLVHFYQHGDDAAADFFDVGGLKKAMAKALVAFYPFAGRLTTDADGRPSIDCNNEGVLFVVARSEQLTVDAFSNLKSLPELRRLFIPCIEPPSTVLAIQVTFLRCGGLALGSAVHHSAVDGHSMFHFLQAWSYLCREGDDAAEAVMDPPCHNRALLQPRSPPVVHPDALAMFSPKTNLHERPPGRPVSTKIFAISDDEVAALKAMCGGASTFTAVSALVWRCACAPKAAPAGRPVEAQLPGENPSPLATNLPDRYFGNAIVTAFVATAVRNIVASGSSSATETTTASLAKVAARISGVMRRLAADNKELLRSAVDYHEMAATATSRWRRPDRGSLPETELRVISWLHLPLYDMDFGWGFPRMMSRAESVRGGFVHVMSGRPADGGGVRVLACLEAENMDEFERLLSAKFTYARI
ncbi:hypothetical protein OsJ_26400 [Oryza sativa Japonica Group]|uniref:Uncharacterized protein n=1 Tax=Oryza sativa subsp. japonica TaxID=39947 RepID=A3BQL6_ORYSJ|nr:hypothetical protein OsJ_26400 [Oryza sativa Japonica Group]